MQRQFEPTRAEGLRRLAAFVPYAGRDYARTRNFDLGPDKRNNVSVLSPYIRHRLITEAEVCAAVLRTHDIASAEKFVQEVCWRTYWKGFLQQRPSIWTSYLEGVAEDRALLAANRNQYERLLAAETGETGIACFDAWARELTATGYLHNHARMWFASIWIFSLRLPWRLGADFFYRHLLDGDPASNTLSWRWVGGLHTRGKTYLARPDNIETYTSGRFASVERLARSAPPLDESQNHPLKPLCMHAPSPKDTPFILLLTEDDLAPESWRIARELVAGVAAASTPARAPHSDKVMDFKCGALADALKRASRHFDAPALLLEATTMADALAAFAAQRRVSHVLASEPTVGPVRDMIDGLYPLLKTHGLWFFETRRRWDDLFWPYAAKGFFALKKRIPAVMTELEEAAHSTDLQRDLFSE